jgi:hypothetical protein
VNYEPGPGSTLPPPEGVEELAVLWDLSFDHPTPSPSSYSSRGVHPQLLRVQSTPGQIVLDSAELGEDVQQMGTRGINLLTECTLWCTPEE